MVSTYTREPCYWAVLIPVRYPNPANNEYGLNTIQTVRFLRPYNKTLVPNRIFSLATPNLIRTLRMRNIMWLNNRSAIQIYIENYNSLLRFRDFIQIFPVLTPVTGFYKKISTTELYRHLHAFSEIKTLANQNCYKC